MASDAVLKYLIDTNRPYSCADVTVNLRGAFTKGAIQKALDALAESGKIKCKLYGKQKVYAAIQLDNAGGDDDAVDYDTEIKALTESLTNTTNALKKAETTLKSLTSLPTNNAAKIEIKEIKKRLESLKNKLETLRSSTEVISAEEKKILVTGHEKLSRECRKRKKISSDMLDALMEGSSKSKKALIEELCLEMDDIVK